MFDAPTEGPYKVASARTFDRRIKRQNKRRRIEKMHATLDTTQKFGSSWINRTVSTGTLNPAHLIPEFTYVLQAVDRDGIVEQIRSAVPTEAWIPEIDEVNENHEFWASVEAGYILEFLFDLLDYLAPVGCSFHTLEGDGTCFGFWSRHSLENLPTEWDEYGKLSLFSVYGGYPLVYWFEEEGGGELNPYCGHCAYEILEDQLGSGCFRQIESGDLYEEDLPCEHCGRQLSGHYEEEEEE